MRELYQSEVRKELTKYVSYNNEVITEQDIAGLPEPVQKYFRNCGYLGQKKMINAKITWKDVYLRLSPKKNWMALECDQFNSVPEPTRIAYMKSRILGIIPFNGRDKYQDGHGNMLVKLLKFIKVADAKGREMDESGLVTVLAETFLVPTYALQDYIKWISIDTKTAKATISNNGCEVSGLFYFNADGEFIRFETEDRYYSEQGTEYTKLKWSAIVSSYAERNGIKFPADFRAVWHTEAGEYEYFKGSIDDIKYNVD